MYRKSIIVAVDDSGFMLKILEQLLNEQYDFHGFSKGERALKYLRKVTPDLIILDIDMPELNGYDLLKMIKNIDDLKEVPVIFLTSSNDSNHVVQAITSGANDYAVKPVKAEILMEKILKLLYNK